MPDCIIIDDDGFALDTFEDMLTAYPDMHVIKKVSNPKTAIKYIATLLPEVVFLDIGMPDKSGIEVFNDIIELNLNTRVVFISAHDDYIMEAFRKKAFDYLIKPINSAELDDTIARLRETSYQQEDKEETQTDQKINFKNSHGTIILNTDDILYAHAEGCYTRIQQVNDNYNLISKNLGKIEHKFPKNRFFKISRSALVNMNYISKIDRLKKMVTLHANNKNTELKASRERLYDLEIRLNDKN